MSGRGQLAVRSVLATVMAACALLPLVDSPGWIVQAALVLAIVSGVGALTRRVPLARPLTVAAQALVALLLLTLLFTREQALGGIVPGPGAFREFGQLLAEGAEDVGQYAIPAPVTSGIRLLMVGGVLLVGLLVDALAVTYRTAAPAGLPLLALYSVAAGLAHGGGRLWFLVAASGYLLLLLAEGRDRLSQWGRVFSPGPGRAGAPAAPPGPSRLGAGLDGSRTPPMTVRTGRRIGAAALGLALVVPVILPSLDGGLLGRHGGGSGPGPGGGTISAVNPLVSLQNSLNQPADREVLRYRTSARRTQDLYLRIVALDRFDGTAWKPSERRVTDVPSTLPAPPGLAPQVRTALVSTRVATADWYAQNWLPLPYPASQVVIDGRWRYEPEGRTLVGDRGQTTRGVRYTVSSLEVRPTAEQLAAAGTPPDGLLREYTQVPDALPAVVARTARQVTSGAPNAYEQAVRLQNWFATEGGFTYDTQVEAGSGAAAIARFLRQKEGFCVHFAFSMAAMARTLGIPARVAVGFTPGSARTDGSMSVGLKDAHAWPELFFAGVGWTRFEPTPTRGTLPDYTIDDQRISGRDTSDVARPTRPAQPTDAPSASDTCSPDLRRLGDCGAAAQQAGGGAGDQGVPGWLVMTGQVLLVVMPLVGLLLLPVLWRVLIRRRRLGLSGPAAAGARGQAAETQPESAPGTPADIAGRTLAAWRELVDSGWDYGILPDDSQTPRQAAERIVTSARLDPAAAESARRVAAAVEQVLYAPRPRPMTGLAADVVRVRTALHRTAGRGARLRALLAPRSAARVAWAASRWWSGLVARWEMRRWTTALRQWPSRQRG